MLFQVLPLFYVNAKTRKMDPVPDQLWSKVQHAESELQCMLDQHHAAMLDQHHAAMLSQQRAQEQQAEVVVLSSDEDDSAVPEDDFVAPAGKHIKQISI